MPKNDFGLGFIYSEDPRDERFTMRQELDIEEPKRASRLWEVDGPKDQGTTSACVGYAVDGWLRADPIKTVDGMHPFDLYREAQRIDEWPGQEPDYKGTSVRAGMRVVQKRGHVEKYVWAWDAETARRWVLTKGTLVAGSRWYSSFYEPDGEGFINVEANRGISGGHAWLIVGYNHTLGAFLCLNSWGADWGRNGYFLVTGELLDRLMNENGQLCAAVEKRLVKKFTDRITSMWPWPDFMNGD